MSQKKGSNIDIGTRVPGTKNGQVVVVDKKMHNVDMYICHTEYTKKPGARSQSMFVSGEHLQDMIKAFKAGNAFYQR